MLLTNIDVNKACTTERGNRYLPVVSKDLCPYYHNYNATNESGSFRPKSRSPLSRFALIPVRPGSFRPGSFRPNSHSLLGCFAQIIKICSDYILCPNMHINQPHKGTDCLVTLATMLIDHAASLSIMLPAGTTRRYDKDEKIDKNNCD